MNDYEISTERMKEIRRLGFILWELNQRLENGRHYLMGIQPSGLTVENTLEAFGYDRSGFETYLLISCQKNENYQCLTAKIPLIRLALITYFSIFAGNHKNDTTTKPVGKSHKQINIVSLWELPFS